MKVYMAGITHSLRENILSPHQFLIMMPLEVGCCRPAFAYKYRHFADYQRVYPFITALFFWSTHTMYIGVHALSPFSVFYATESSLQNPLGFFLSMNVQLSFKTFRFLLMLISNSFYPTQKEKQVDLRSPSSLIGPGGLFVLFRPCSPLWNLA